MPGSAAPAWPLLSWPRHSSCFLALSRGQRVDRANAELSDLRQENVDLRVRLEELSVAQEEAKEMGARVSTSTSMRQMRSTFEPGPIGAVANNMGLKNF